MGHRNWILVDSAYPEQVGAGIETIETDAGQLEVVRTVLSAVQKSIHVRPIIFMDASFPSSRQGGSGCLELSNPNQCTAP
jgi:hypothetical protein